jgi:hypothetical protein
MNNQEIFDQIIKILESAEIQLQEYDAPEIRIVLNTLMGALQAGSVTHLSSLCLLFSAMQMENIALLKLIENLKEENENE